MNSKSAVSKKPNAKFVSKGTPPVPPCEHVVFDGVTYVHSHVGVITGKHPVVEVPLLQVVGVKALIDELSNTNAELGYLVKKQINDLVDSFMFQGVDSVIAQQTVKLVKERPARFVVPITGSDSYTVFTGHDRVKTLVKKALISANQTTETFIASINLLDEFKARGDIESYKKCITRLNNDGEEIADEVLEEYPILAADFDVAHYKAQFLLVEMSNTMVKHKVLTRETLRNCIYTPPPVKLSDNELLNRLEKMSKVKGIKLVIKHPSDLPQLETN